MTTKASEISVQPKKRNRPATPTNPTTGGFEISDQLWAVLAPLLPVYINKHRFGGGRSRVPDRKCANGIFYVLRTGCQWKALDQTGICSGSTAHLRFQEWVEAGVFLDLWRVGLEKYDELTGIDWSWLSMDKRSAVHFVDGATPAPPQVRVTKAPLGGEKNRPQPNRPRKIGRQTQSVDGSQRHPDRVGSGRGQSK